MQIDTDLFQAIGFAIMFLLTVIIAWMLAEFRGMKEEIRQRLGINNETIRMKLQAYERLTFLAERIGLRNLAARILEPGDTVIGFQSKLLESINGEYDYNTSQQLYVNPEIWAAMTKLRDHNIYVINQIAAPLPAVENGKELARLIIEYSMNEKAELNQIVLEAIRQETKKLMV
jgi:hypothetical protein